MKIDLLIINPPFHKRNGGGTVFPLGLEYIFAAIKNSYTYDVINCPTLISRLDSESLKKFRAELRIELDKYEPMVVGIGPCVTTQARALKVIAECCVEKFGKNIIFAGGPLTAIEGQEWFFFDFLNLDYIIKGDGETAILNVLHAMKIGKNMGDIENVTTRKRKYFNEISDIDKVNFPVRDYEGQNSFSIRRNDSDIRKTAAMITSRGCPYSCNYCVSGNIKYRKFRKRTFENIVEEMVVLYQKYNINDIVFYDDCFFYKHKAVHNDIKKFCELLIYQKINVSWQMEMRVDLFQELNKQDIFYLEKSGCRQINLGIESTNAEETKYFGKKVPIAGLKEKIEYLHQNSRIKVAGTFILGGKYATEQTIKKVIDDSINMELDYAHYSPLFVYPGTPIYKEYFKNDERAWVNFILEDDWPWGEIVYENEYLDREKLIGLVEFAYKTFYENSKYSNRKMVTDRYNLKETKGGR